MRDTLLALVTSAARAKVLTALFAVPRRAYYQQELARELALPLLAIQRELRRLVGAGLVTAHETAGRRMFEANEASAIYHDLTSIVLKLRGIVAQLREPVHEARLAWIFGSFAAADATASSDVDLMVLGTIKPRELRRRLGQVERVVDRSINEHVLEPAEWTRRLAERDRFLSEVRSGPRLWVLGNENALARLDPAR